MAEFRKRQIHLRNPVSNGVALIGQAVQCNGKAAIGTAMETHRVDWI